MTFFKVQVSLQILRNAEGNHLKNIVNAETKRNKLIKNPVNGVFSFQRINVQKVTKLLKTMDVGKATGLDKIPNTLLKIATDVVAPSLTDIFNQPQLTVIFPSDWKLEWLQVRPKQLPAYIFNSCRSQNWFAGQYFHTANM